MLWCNVMILCHDFMSWCDVPHLHVMLITLPVSTCMSGPPSTTTSASVAMYVSMYHNHYIRELSETFAQQIIVIASNAQNPGSARVCLIQYKLLRLRAVSSSAVQLQNHSVTCIQPAEAANFQNNSKLFRSSHFTWFVGETLIEKL